jgi:hypothetical protein
LLVEESLRVSKIQKCAPWFAERIGGALKLVRKWVARDFGQAQIRELARFKSSHSNITSNGTNILDRLEYNAHFCYSPQQCHIMAYSAAVLEHKNLIVS